MTVTDDRAGEPHESGSTPEPPTATPIRSGRNLDKLAELEEERRYLLRSLKDLESERAAGDVDEVDYETLKDGYTVRAASVLRQIEDGRRALAPKQPRNWKRTIVVTVAVAAFAAAVGVALASAFGERGANDEITGRSPADDTRTTLASARAALNRGDLPRAQQLFIRADQDEIERSNDSAEARAYVGWTTALLAWAAAPSDTESTDPDEVVAAKRANVDPRQLDLALLALGQSISIDPTFADPHCFTAIVEFNFRGDADAALPFAEECAASNPPADIAGLIAGLEAEIRAEIDADDAGN